MGWLAKIFRAVPREELNGISLNLDEPFWEIEGESEFPKLLHALMNLLPEDSILYFENGSPNRELRAFFAAHSIPEQAHLAYGTVWPRPQVFHVPATPQNLMALAELSESCASPELAVHFHVYRRDKVLLQWHDAFTQPLLLSGEFSEDKVRVFCRVLSMKYRRTSSVEKQAQPDSQ